METEKNDPPSHGTLAAHAVDRVNMLKQDWTSTLNPNDCIMTLVRQFRAP